MGLSGWFYAVCLLSRVCKETAIDLFVCLLFPEWILCNLHPVLHQLPQVSSTVFHQATLLHSTQEPWKGFIHASAINVVTSLNAIFRLVVLQLCGGPHRLHEEQDPGQVLPGPPGLPEALAPSGLLPAQARPANPQIPPAAGGTAVPAWNLCSPPQTSTSLTSAALLFISLLPYIGPFVCQRHASKGPWSHAFPCLLPRQEIARHYDPEEIGYEVIQEAIDTMTGVAWYINDMKRKHEHAVRLQVREREREREMCYYTGSRSVRLNIFTSLYFVESAGRDTKTIKNIQQYLTTICVIIYYTT